MNQPQSHSLPRPRLIGFGHQGNACGIRQATEQSTGPGVVVGLANWQGLREERGGIRASCGKRAQIRNGKVTIGRDGPGRSGRRWGSVDPPLGLAHSLVIWRFGLFGALFAGFWASSGPGGFPSGARIERMVRSFVRLPRRLAIAGLAAHPTWTIRFII
jgi:hypothetical protein